MIAGGVLYACVLVENRQRRHGPAVGAKGGMASAYLSALVERRIAGKFSIYWASWSAMYLLVGMRRVKVQSWVK